MESTGLQCANRLKAAQDSHDAVILAGIRDGIDVRAGADDWRLWIGAVPAREGVSNRVLPYRKPRGFAPLDHPRARLHVCRSEKNSCDDRRIRLRNGGQLFYLRMQPLGIDR